MTLVRNTWPSPGAWKAPTQSESSSQPPHCLRHNRLDPPHRPCPWLFLRIGARTHALLVALSRAAALRLLVFMWWKSSSPQVPRGLELGLTLLACSPLSPWCSAGIGI